MLVEGFFGLIVYVSTGLVDPAMAEINMIFGSKARCEEVRYDMSEDFKTSECFPVVCEDGECWYAE